MQPWFIEFAEGIAAGDPAVRQCDDCNERWLPPRSVCPACGSSTFESVPLPTEGQVESFTSISATIPTFVDDTPYSIAFVRLDEDLALVGQWRGSDDDLALGVTAAVDTEAVDDGYIITFAPVDR